MNYQFPDRFAASRQTRPLARPAHGPTFALCMFALIAAFFASALPAQRADAAANPTIYSFGTSSAGTGDGQNPEAPPVEDANGNLWGTTYNGGTYGYGTIWELVKQSQTAGTAPPPATKEVVYSFGGPASDGNNPVGGLVLNPVDHFLYGVTAYGGTNGYGAFFQINPATGAEQTVYSLTTATAEPDNPTGTPVTDGAGNFYFPCFDGGTYGAGGIIKVSGSGSAYSQAAAYSFGKYRTSSAATSDGAYPIGPLCIGRDGNIYGTTSDSYYGVYNGVTEYGTVFKFNTSLTTTVTPTLYLMLGGNKGSYTTSGLIQGIGSDTNLYGTCITGGAAGYGDVFSISTTGTFTELYAFPSAPSTTVPAYPQGTLTISTDGTTLFGTTTTGGGSGYTTATGGKVYGGNIFQLVISSKTYTNLWGFTGNLSGTSTDSLDFYNTKDTTYYGYFYPYNALFTDSGLFLAPDGYIYGTGLYSGTKDYGTVYRVGPPQTYNYTFFVTGASASLGVVIDDYMAAVTDSYTINSPSHGTLSTPLTGSFTSAPTTLTRTYTLTGGYVGVDGFTYTGTNTADSHLGTSLTGASAYGNVTIYDGSITATATPTSVTGTTTALAAGGTLPASSDTTLTYTWGTSGTPPAAVTFSGTTNGTNAAKSGVTATFTKAGSYTILLTVTAPDGTLYTTTVAVTVVSTVGAFTVSPNPGTVGTGGTLQMTSTATDQFGNSATPTWSVSPTTGGTSISASGLLTAGTTTGAVTVTAMAGGQTATATVNITTPQVVLATAATANSVSPTYPATGTFTGSTVTLKATGTYSGTGGNAAIIYTWSNTGPSGVTYSPNGTDAASTSTATFTQAGTYVFTVTMTAPTGTPVTSQVTVIVTAAAKTITISPLGTTGTPINMENGTQLQFTATVKDQFGNTISSPSITWAYEYAGDTITTSGLLTEFSGAGPDYVSATSNGITAYSYIQVYDDTLTFSTAATATPNPVTGTTTTLSCAATYPTYSPALQATPSANSFITYQWYQQTGPATATLSSGGALATVTATFTKAGVYTFYVNATSASGLYTKKSPTSGYLTVTVNQTATGITITPASGASIDPGTTQTLTASAVDQFGNALTTQPSVTWSITSGGGSLSSTTTNPTIYTAPGTNGSVTIKVVSGTASATATYTIQQTPPTVVSAAAANGVTGTYTDNNGDTQVDLTALGSYGGNASNLTYTWSYTGPSGVTYTSATNGTNGAQNIYANFTQAGTYVFTVTIKDPAGLTVTSSVTVILKAVGTTITVTPPGTNAAPFYIQIGTTQQFTAVETDQFGNALSSQPTFTWTSVFANVTQTGFYTATYRGGVGYDGAIATDSATGASGESVIYVQDGTLTVGSATATPNPVTGTTTLLSATGNWAGNASDLTYKWSNVTGPAAVTLSPSNATASNANQNTTATFTAAGTYTFKVVIKTPTALGYAGQSVNTTITVVVNATPTTVTLTANPTTLALGPATSALSASVKDQFGTIIATPSFTWAITSGPGSLNTTTGATNTYNSTNPGTSTITATDGSAVGTATITVTDVAPVLGAITVSPNPVTGVTGQLAVTGNYGGSGPLTYTWSSTAGPAPVTFAGGTSASPGSPATTTATFTKAGSYTVQVVAKDPSGTSSNTATVTFTVNATYTSVNVTPNPVSLPVGGSQQFTAVAYDQFGNALATQPTFTWTDANSGGAVSTVSASGLLAAGGVPGTAVVTASATVGSVTYTSTAQVTITDVAPTLSAITSNHNPLTGTAATFTVTGTYAGSGTLTYAWSATGPSNVVFAGGTSGTSGTAVTTTGTFNAIGTYTVTVIVTDASGQSATQTYTETVSPAESKILTNLPLSVAINGTVTATATAYDQFGVALASQPSFSWSVTAGAASGSIAASTGVFTATGTAGTATISVTGSTVTTTGTITVINQPPTVATAASATPNPVTTGKTTTLSVLGAYAGTGGEGALTYTWSAVAGPATPSFSVNGSNAAKSSVCTFVKAGTYDLRVTITDAAGGTTSSDVTVVVNQTLTTIVVTPGPTDTETIGTGTQTYVATGYGQFGNPMAITPTFTWTSSNPAVGSVNSSTGVFTIGTTPGTTTITATSGGVSGSTVVTVADVAPTVGTAASAVPSPVTGTTTSLSVLGQYVGGESSLTYTWSATGPASVTYSDNGTNTAKTATATFTQAGTYTFTVTIKDPYNGSVTSSVSVLVYATKTSITVTPNPATVTINGTQQFSATLYDQFSNPITGVALAWSVKNGYGTITSGGLYTAGTVPGQETVEAAVAGATGDAIVNVTDIAPTLGSITVNPNPVTGTTATCSVTGSYSGTGTLTYSWTATGPAAVNFSGGNSGSSGSAVTTTATFGAAGTYTIKVTVSDIYGTSTTTSTTVTVNQTITAISISPNGSNVPIGGMQTFTGTATDQFGAPLTTQPTFTWSVSGGGTINASTGVYTAPTTPGGTATITATIASPSLSATATANIVDVSPTVATAASATPNPVTATTTNLSVLGAYVGGESNLTYTWSVQSGPSTVAFSANGTNAAKSTVATFNQAGTYVLTVAIIDPSSGLAGSQVTVVVNQTGGPVTITPSPATLPIGGTLQFSASQNDQFGNPLNTQPTFTYSVTSGGGTVDSIGNYTAPLTPGTATVKAVSSSGGSATVTITITDATPTVATAASASPNPVSGTTGTTTNLSVLGAYVGGESTLTYTWAVTTGPTGVTFSANGTNLAKNTIATFTQAGTYTFTVTIADASGNSVTSSVTVNVDQTLSYLNISPNSPSVSIGGTQQFTFVAQDQFGNTMSPTPSVTWAVVVGTGTISSGGLYTATLTPGTSTIKLTSGSISDTTSITVTDTPVTVATAASATPNPVTGTTTALSVLGAWAGGEGNLSYSWTATGPSTVGFAPNGSNAAKNATATFTKAGSYTITCTITDGYGGSATSSVTVTVNDIQTSLTISPTSATINVGGTKQFTATATDQFGNVLTPTLTWTVTSGPGSVSSTGLYTAGATAGTAIVHVSGGGQSATATVTVSDVAPTVATAASATPNPVTAETTNLSVLGAYAAGESNLAYTWSLTSGPAAVTYSANATNAAKNTTATFTQAGSYAFLVTISTPGGLTVTSSVTVTVNQTPTTFTVSPTSATVAVNGSQQITAQLSDQFGNPVTPAPTVTWTITSGGGTVNANGQFVAPNSAGTTVVKATSGTFSASSTLTIVDGSPSIAVSAAATPNPVTAKTTALSVLGAYIGGESNLTYTWSATGPAAVAYSVNGTNAAKNTTATFTKAGTYAFTVTLTTPSGYTATNTVTVVVNQTPTSVTVTPNPGSVGTSGTLQMTATSLDQFGSAISPAPAFTWAVASGGGSISSSGLYTAPATTGTATVKATAGTATGTATINIIAAGTLTGTVSMSNAAVNLTTQGTLDWNHWGRGAPGLDQKSGGNLLSGYTLLGSAAASSYRTDPRLLSWTNGTPTASSTSNATGVDVGGIGNGFQVMSPAIGTTRTVVVYVGGTNAGGTLTAKLSDGSVAPYVNTIATTSGLWDAEYTITYASGSANASLIVSWVQASGTGAVTLSAVTLH